MVFWTIAALTHFKFPSRYNFVLWSDLSLTFLNSSLVLTGLNWWLALTVIFHVSLRLHEVLMDLQNLQLQQLTNWLDVTEARIKRFGSQPLGPDLEDIKHQVEEHKVGTSWRGHYIMSHLVESILWIEVKHYKIIFQKTLFKHLFFYLELTSKQFWI